MVCWWMKACFWGISLSRCQSQESDNLHAHTHIPSHFQFILAKHRLFSVLSVWNWAQVRPHKGRFTPVLKNIMHLTPISPSITSAPLATQVPCGILLMTEAGSCSEEWVVLIHSLLLSLLFRISPDQHLALVDSGWGVRVEIATFDLDRVRW